MSAADLSPDTAVYLSESSADLNEGASFLDRLSAAELDALRKLGTTINAHAGETVFNQGDPHGGIWLIERGTIRTFYVSPSGREITLASWTPGHFVGGPELFGVGEHIWSALAVTDATLLFLKGSTLRDIIGRFPDFALCLIEGLVAKGKCYSALVQMLGTRSVTERLTHLLVILASTHGRADGERLVIERQLTHEEIACIVGGTRQWVTKTLDKLQKSGVISVTRKRIVVENVAKLNAQLAKS